MFKLRWTYQQLIFEFIFKLFYSYGRIISKRCDIHRALYIDISVGRFALRAISGNADIRYCVGFYVDREKFLASNNITNNGITTSSYNAVDIVR